MTGNGTRDDYRGPFDPDWDLAACSRTMLARLCREYQMLSMFHDRALMPLVLGVTGSTDDMVVLAEGEWMGSSPVWNRRNREGACIGGDNVEAIFKALQSRRRLARPLPRHAL